MDQALTQIHQDLELIKKVSNDQEAIEFWLARELMPLLGYSTWRQFSEAIERAKEACKISGQPVDNHFLPAPAKSTGGRPKEDYFLTRYACYLIAQNGDPRKPQIALAQTYFASQTRKQELMEQRETENKRLEARAKLKETESKIESTVYTRGIKLSVEFATFKNKHIEALYGGIPASQLKKIRKIPSGRSLADFDSQVELKAKDFALAMTDHNIKEQNIVGKEAMNQEVVKNSKETRQALLNRGIRPELIKPEEDLKAIESRRKKEAKEIKGKQADKFLK
ncbi:MAG: DNA damage-inducible protein D [Deltaproteobacteria bacterium CG_4_10_14_3_um_filter_51_14]|uniref:DNA damage-inducible protein D n=1 Tax=Candidatus Falkowbacteria bacterium CG23_combo_of_CG06-09_8_20_14_all_49_15 TaxID=1974572 RepID=A0A2G9ZK87_9BACT|nr:MAG: DNA damage-inducible protein D [Candidatus Falkowbacteria bacterium CG23_combo_of_CG06-09_8_20_14_all_49_15]PIY24607.1 MAG: DNA damage-inducible protein D [Deltaproteobacteria bacterium CG_4_10_14_3_um_filter_51_14]